MSTLIIVQARLGSSRFPKKILEPLYGLTVLELVLKKCLEVEEAEKIVVAVPHQDKSEIKKIIGHLPVEIFDGSGADIVLEASGSYLGAENAIKLVVPGGKIVLQSLCGAKNQGAFNLDHVVVNDITLRGALGSPGIWPDVVRLIENGQIEPEKIVTHEFPLKGFFEALKVIRQGDSIKLVIRP